MRGRLRFGCLSSVLIAAVLAPGQARAHWCDDLWGSAYNLTIRPESDTVDLSAGGSAQLVVYVQNNMGYPLLNFKLSAKVTGYNATPTAGTTKVANYLMPGERQKVTFAITRSSGAAQLPVSSIDFYVNFGQDGVSPRQDDLYPAATGKAAVVKTSTGLLPVGFPSLAAGVENQRQLDQARQLQHMAQADFGNLNTGLDDLLQRYCAGRNSWQHDSEYVKTTNCSSTTATTCPAKMANSVGTKYDWMRLWAAPQLAARKASLGARAAVFRERLKCGYNDDSMAYKAVAAISLGYLGEDTSARCFLLDKVTNGASADEKTLAKAALYLMGNCTDVATYKTDVTSCASTGYSNVYVADACATALGIRDRNDTVVNSVLVSRARWTEPDTSDDGKAMVAAHLLQLVAWDRRGWAPAAAEAGTVSFYGEAAGGTAPACTSTAGSCGGGGTGGATGSGGAAGTGGKTGSGGAAGTGGKAGSGGAVGTGGTATGSGGAGGTGGTVTDAGVPGSGGKTGSGGKAAGSGGKASVDSGVTDPAEASGCACSSQGGQAPSSLAVSALMLLVAAAVVRRRR